MRLTRILFQWREAATVMMFAKTGNKVHSPVTPNNLKLNNAKGPVKSTFPTSTIPNAASKSIGNDNFRILMLERSSKSRFMPSAYVFPGGRISESDYSSEWLELYKPCGVLDINSALPEISQGDANRAPMFTLQRDWPINSNVAFRICSIRETFEEAGILLCKHKDDLISGQNTAWEALDKHKLQDWRPIICKDDQKFIEMCRELSVVPDVWSLYEWSCWLTPTNMDKLHGGKRYDTAFYICGIPEHIDAIHDDEEIVHSKWVTVADVLSTYEQNNLWLAPPQIYELRRLGNFSSYMDLNQFARDRQNNGTERWLPVRITFSDGIVAVLPGDDLYPSNVDLEGLKPAPEINLTIEESLNTSKKLHRFEIRSSNDCILKCNMQQNYGHAPPKPIAEIVDK